MTRSRMCLNGTVLMGLAVIAAELHFVASPGAFAVTLSIGDSKRGAR